MAALEGLDLTPAPDLCPIYPHPNVVSVLVAPTSGLSPAQKRSLVRHCLARACTFGDLQVLSYLLSDPLAQPFVDLDMQDEEDGLSLVSLAILGFGANSERDVEREECVRLLITEGANVNLVDKAGWTPLHHASLLSPPTLISFLLTHGCSPLTLTRRKLTAWDIVTAHSSIPGREDVALLLEEAMREAGWQGGGRREKERRIVEEKARRRGKLKEAKTGVGRVLGLHDQWWGGHDDSRDSSSEDEEGMDLDDGPSSHDFSAMLAFSPISLPHILNSLITTFRPTLRCSEPAQALHLLARFACISCDHLWLEDVIVGAVDRIEEQVYSQPDEIVHLAFWLYNSTILLHLLRCDADVAETCDILGLFLLLEELLNAIYVFIIRIAERRVDPLLDAALLDHTPHSAETPQFESEWSFFRSLAPRKKPAPLLPPSSPTVKSLGPATARPSTPTARPPSPSPNQLPASASATRFASLRQTITRATSNGASPEPQLSAPQDIVSILTALHSLLTFSGINPVIIIQAFSQVLYWSACELFNRLLTRKKYLCRSRAMQIGLNMAVLEEWVATIGLPQGVLAHFAPVREMLHWLETQSVIDQFASLVAEIQAMKNLNPLQMRRAVRDYRYEVSESRMTEECVQYLAQLQKDWERHRVKIGVEAIRREISEKERDRDGSVSGSSLPNDDSLSGREPSISGQSASTTTYVDPPPVQQSIDLLFSRSHSQADWAPQRPPEVLGELLDSRCMLPLVLPSDPHMLAAAPKGALLGVANQRANGAGMAKHESALMAPNGRAAARSTSRTRSSGRMEWAARARKVRDVRPELLDRVDGAYSIVRRVPLDISDVDADGDDERMRRDDAADALSDAGSRATSPHFTANPLMLKPSQHLRAGRSSMGGGEAEDDELVGLAL